MNAITNLDDISFLLDNKVPESHILEYKSSDVIQTDSGKKQIVKAVSAFANAEGGQLIIGIKETKDKQGINQANELKPIKETAYTREWLEQIILGNISPVIDGVKIVSITTGPGETVYIVNVPQGNTAHQSSLHCQYFRRRNFKSEPMLDFEIREVMNRVKHPQLTLDFTITTDLTQDEDREYTLVSTIKNIGSIYATHINYSYTIPVSIIPNGWELEYNEHTVKHTNLFNAMVYIPILPGCSGAVKEFKVVRTWDTKSELSIKWKIYADNAPIKEGETFLRDIIIRDIS